MNTPLRVLIVEDSEDDMLLLVRQLKRGGYEPGYERVDTPEAMNAALDRQTWDIIISDYVMPRFSGLDALKLMQSRGLDLPFIIISGKIGEDVAVDAMKAGAGDYVMKDNLARLISAIRRELQEAEVRRERRRAEKALAEQYAILEAIYENTVAPLALIDSDFRFVRVNKAYATADGCVVSDYPGQDIFELHSAFEYRAIFEDVVRTKKPFQVFAMPYTHKSRPERGSGYVDGALMPVLDSSGNVEFLVLSINDVTERVRAEQALIKKTRILTMLSAVNQILVRTSEESALLHNVCRITVEAGGYRLAWIGFAEHNEEKTVRPMCSAGHDEGYLHVAKMTWSDTPLGNGPTGTAIRTGKPAYVRDMATDPLFAPWRDEAMKHGYASSISIPLIANDQVFGALNLYSGERYNFEPEEVELLTELANDLSYGITSIRARKEVQRTEEHKREFYRRTILAATQGKLMICEQEEIREIAGAPIASWKIRRAEDLAALRQSVADISRSAGMEESRVSDFILCLGEASTNAIKHAGGGTVSIHKDGDSLLFMVSDHGPGIEELALPEVALRKGYTTARSLGMGYKAMISLADMVYLATGPEGTTVAVRMKLHKPEEQPDVAGMIDTW